MQDGWRYWWDEASQQWQQHCLTPAKEQAEPEPAAAEVPPAAAPPEAAAAPAPPPPQAQPWQPAEPVPVPEQPPQQQQGHAAWGASPAFVPEAPQQQHAAHADLADSFGMAAPQQPQQEPSQPEALPSSDDLADSFGLAADDQQLGQAAPHPWQPQASSSPEPAEPFAPPPAATPPLAPTWQQQAQPWQPSSAGPAGAAPAAEQPQQPLQPQPWQPSPSPDVSAPPPHQQWDAPQQQWGASLSPEPAELPVQQASWQSSASPSPEPHAVPTQPQQWGQPHAALQQHVAAEQSQQQLGAFSQFTPPVAGASGAAAGVMPHQPQQAPFGGGYASYGAGQPHAPAPAAPHGYGAATMHPGGYSPHGRPPAAFGKLLFGGRVLLASPTGAAMHALPAWGHLACAYVQWKRSRVASLHAFDSSLRLLRCHLAGRMELRPLQQAPAECLQPLAGAPCASLSDELRLLESFPGPLGSGSKADKVGGGGGGGRCEWLCLAGS